MNAVGIDRCTYRSLGRTRTLLSALTLPRRTTRTASRTCGSFRSIGILGKGVVHPSLEANRIIANRVKTVMQVLVDGGGIYTSSPNR